MSAREGYPATPGWIDETTSRDAAFAVTDRAHSLREAVFAILSRRAMTADEVAAVLGESVLSMRPRVTELYKEDRIDRTGERRQNRSGLFAHVYRISIRPSFPFAARAACLARAT
jgi:predicted ArsR family transcriptional regulator